MTAFGTLSKAVQAARSIETDANAPYAPFGSLSLVRNAAQNEVAEQH